MGLAAVVDIHVHTLVGYTEDSDTGIGVLQTLVGGQTATLDGTLSIYSGAPVSTVTVKSTV